MVHEEVQVGQDHRDPRDCKDQRDSLEALETLDQLGNLEHKYVLHVYCIRFMYRYATKRILNICLHKLDQVQA